MIVKEVFYPKYSPTKALYDKCRNPHGGYGGLFSVTFHSTEAAAAFFDTLEVLKGPSLGTNFTLRFFHPFTLFHVLKANLFHKLSIYHLGSLRRIGMGTLKRSRLLSLMLILTNRQNPWALRRIWCVLALDLKKKKIWKLEFNMLWKRHAKFNNRINGAGVIVYSYTISRTLHRFVL